MSVFRQTDEWLKAYNARMGGTAPKTTDAPAIRAAKPVQKAQQGVKSSIADDFSEKPASVVLELPWPPTGNHAVKHTRNGSHYLTTEAKRYRSAVFASAHKNRPKYTLFGRLRIVVRLCPPDKRKRDLDNAWKTLSDALQWAGVYADDCQIDDLRLIRVLGQPGTVVVEISEV